MQKSGKVVYRFISLTTVSSLEEQPIKFHGAAFSSLFLPPAYEGCCPHRHHWPSSERGWPAVPGEMLVGSVGCSASWASRNSLIAFMRPEGLEY